MNQSRYDSWSRAISLLLKIVGVLGIVFVPVFWAFTGKVELTFLPFFGMLAGVGEGISVLKEITTNKGGEK